jgi:3'-phosphoadenosine 5'-phosphosulfate sulfotransferase (PAPS reductase)/FAD synthetase
MNTLFPPPDIPTIRLRVLSLGAGVQSTTLALMAAHGEIGPMPDAAIFADTCWEPQNVYDHLAWLTSPNVLPFPVHIVSAGNIRDGLIRGARGERWASIPAFTLSKSGKVGMIRRQCTKELKIVPIRRKVRELAGIFGKRSPKSPVVEQWIGISRDEVIRMKPSFEDWQVNRFPLIETGMTRRDCLRWLERHGYPLPPKSSCIGCPYHSDAHWRQMREEDPEAWADAVAIDRKIRSGFRHLRGEVFLHRSCMPLDEADIDTPEDKGQFDLFGAECEGMCGV